MSEIDIDRLRKDVRGFAGRFFYDQERGDIAYIAKACDDKQCDCERKVNADGDQDCSHSLYDWEHEDHLCEPIVEMLNAVGPLLDALSHEKQEHEKTRREVERLRGEIERRPTEQLHVAVRDTAYAWQRDCAKAEALVNELRAARDEACEIAERYIKEAWPTIQSWDGTRISTLRSIGSTREGGE